MSRAKPKKISGGEIVLLTAFILFLMLFFLAYIYRPASKIVTQIVAAERSKSYRSMAVDYLREKYGMGDIFDGTNLDEIMKNKSGDITMLYVNTEFNDCEFFDWIQKYRINAMFVSFDSPESFNEVAGQNYTFLFSSAKDWLRNFGDHITDIREIKS